MDLEQKIFRQIEQEDIRIQPRFVFYAKDAFKFSVALLLVGISAVFSGIAIAFGVHWGSEISTTNFPYALVVLSIIMAFFAYEFFVRSFSFYKIRFSFGMAALFLLAVSLGYFMLANGHTEKLERKLQNFSMYRKVVPKVVWDYEKVEDAD